MDLNLKDFIFTGDKSKHSKTYVKGHVLIKDDFGNVILEKDNLVLLNTRIFLFEHLFKVGSPNSNNGYDKDRHNMKVCLFRVGQGGADVNATPFNPYVPVFSDTDLNQPVPFITYDNSKQFNEEMINNQSIIDTDIDYETTPRGTYDNKNIYYKKYYKCLPEGLTLPIADVKPYYAKLINIENYDNLGWNTDYHSTGELSYKLSLSIDVNECRGNVINELGLILADFNLTEITNDTEASLVSNTINSNSVTFPCYVANDVKDDWLLATRITFDSISLTSTYSKFNIFYTLYI